MSAERGFKPAALPEDEAARIKELRLLRLLDSGSEARFDRITKLAATLFDAPIALFSLVDTNRQWFKSACGLTLSETGRDISFCAHAILESQLLVIPDAAKDPRFAHNPLVTGEPYIRFYAGAVLRGPRGTALGTLCLIDRKPREFPASSQALLLSLAEILEGELRHESEVQEVRKQAFANAHYDRTTGLPNARLFSDRLEQALTISRRTQDSLLVGLVEVNGLIDVRTVFGDAIGDRVMKACADRLTGALSDLCTIAFWRDETFALLLPVVPHADAASAFLELVYKTLAEPLPVNGRTLHFEALCGAARYPEGGLETEELLQHASFALREAKEHPQLHWHVYSYEMNLRMARRVDMEQHLRDAVHKGRLDVVFQPIVDMETLEIHRVEALCRWTDPAFGSIYPEEFIPLAERSNLILDLDRLVIAKALAATLEWDRAVSRPIMLSLNLSSRTLTHPGLVEWLEQTLGDARFDYSRVILEVTESSLVADVGWARRNLARCRELGFSVSIDDFGTGFSSFDYLKRLAVDELKIDRVFVKEITEHRRDASIVRNIITLARDLGISVVAEGIETYEQLIYLQAYHCDEGQGFYFSLPLGADALQTRLMEQGARLRR